MAHKILMIDDSRLFSQLVSKILKKRCPECELILYNPMEKGKPDRSFKWQEYDLLLLDYHLGMEGETGLDWLQYFKRMPAFPPTVLVTGEGTEMLAVQAMKAGAGDYVSKEGMQVDVLVDAIRNNMRNMSSGLLHDSQESREFVSHLEAAVKVADSEHFALVYVEMDDIKSVREQGGMAAVNKLLLMAEDVVYHLSNEHFEVSEWIRWGDATIACFVKGPNVEQKIFPLAKAICSQIKQIQLETTSASSKMNTASVGLVYIEDSSILVADIMKKAEAAARAAGIKGGDTAYMFPRDAGEDEKLSKTSVYRVQIREHAAHLGSGVDQTDMEPIDLEKAIKSDRFSYRYQLIAAMQNTDANQSVRSYFDVIPYYQDYVGNSLSYEQFLPALKNCVRLNEFDLYMFRAVMKIKADYVKSHPDTPIGLFLTAASNNIQLRIFLEKLHATAKKLEKQKIGDGIILRVRLRDYVEQPVHIAKYMFELKKLAGLRFCVTGIDHAEQLQWIQRYKIFEYVELAGFAESELIGMTADHGQLQQVMLILKENANKLIARGIETPDQLMTALMHGADFAQGSMIGEVTDEINADAGMMQNIEL